MTNGQNIITRYGAVTDLGAWGFSPLVRKKPVHLCTVKISLLCTFAEPITIRISENPN